MICSESTLEADHDTCEYASNEGGQKNARAKNVKGFCVFRFSEICGFQEFVSGCNERILSRLVFFKGPPCSYVRSFSSAHVPMDFECDVMETVGLTEGR